jgi:hypothetical protein
MDTFNYNATISTEGREENDTSYSDLNSNTESNVENDPTIIAYNKTIELSKTAMTVINHINNLTVNNQSNNNPLPDRLIPTKPTEFKFMISKLQKCMETCDINSLREFAPYSEGKTLLNMFSPYAARIHVVSIGSSITHIMHVRNEWALAALDCLHDYNNIPLEESLQDLRYKSKEGNDYYKFLCYVTEKWGILYQVPNTGIYNRRLTREIFMNLNAIKENYEVSTQFYRDSVEFISNTYKQEYNDINTDIEYHKKGGHLPIFKAEKFFYTRGIN